MSEIRIDIPESVGLSEDQITRLREKFRCDLIEVLRSRDPGEVLPQLRPELKVLTETITKAVMVDK